MEVKVGKFKIRVIEPPNENAKLRFVLYVDYDDAVRFIKENSEERSFSPKFYTVFEEETADLAVIVKKRLKVEDLEHIDFPWWCLIIGKDKKTICFQWKPDDPDPNCVQIDSFEGQWSPFEQATAEEIIEYLNKHDTPVVKVLPIWCYRRKEQYMVSECECALRN